MMPYITGNWGVEAKLRSSQRNDYFRNYRNKINRQKRIEVLTMMGGKCVICKFSDWRALQIDHKDGNGNKERKSLKYNSQIYKLVLQYPERYQPLCANCNWIKRYEKGEAGELN